MRKYIVPTLIALGLMLVTGCTQNPWETSGRGDAPINDSKTDDSAAEIINFPDMFANVARKCQNGVGIYTTSNGGNTGVGRGLEVIPNDPNCPQNATTTTTQK
jgi:hypothetical protein